MLRAEVPEIGIGSIFLFVGLASCAIAEIRRGAGTLIFVWLGIWSAMYGAVELSRSPAFLAVLPPSLQAAAPYAYNAMLYLVIVVGLLAFRELTRGKLRLLLQAAAFAGLAIAVGAVSVFISTGSPGRFTLYNSLLSAALLATLMAVVAVPALSARYLVLPDRGVLAIGTLLFIIEALCNSLLHLRGFKTPRILDHLGFAVLLFSFGYVALRLVLVNERRLLLVERELAIARDIQTSILPAALPELCHARISAAYRPMAAVGGDFYEFLPVDPHHAGFLVADVCGHGVPAALIASMVKIAAQTLAPSAHDPAAVMGGLNRILSTQLRGQLVSAAYLWLDMEARQALYTAAGHPPLLRWRQGKLEPIESNGLLIGVPHKLTSYPVIAIPVDPGDRFLLYTDGLTEPQNAAGDSFGDSRLEQLARDHRSCPPAEFSDLLLSEIGRWQPVNVPQQDDITLLVIDAE